MNKLEKWLSEHITIAQIITGFLFGISGILNLVVSALLCTDGHWIAGIVVFLIGVIMTAIFGASIWWGIKPEED